MAPVLHNKILSGVERKWAGRVRIWVLSLVAPWSCASCFNLLSFTFPIYTFSAFLAGGCHQDWKGLRVEKVAVLLFPFSKRGNGGTSERLNNLPEFEPLSSSPSACIITIIWGSLSKFKKFSFVATQFHGCVTFWRCCLCLEIFHRIFFIALVKLSEFKIWLSAL